VNINYLCPGLRLRPAAAAAIAAVAAAALLPAQGAWASDGAEASDDVKLNWTNTFKYSAAFRLKQADPVLLANPNADDGNRNFGKGLIANRGEWLTELDAVAHGGFGARVSATAWYDTVYNTSNDNPGFAGGAAPNQTSTQYNEFTGRTRDLHGRRGELRDAFVFASADLGGTPLTARLGQHAVVWGESLFFANNAIAGAQNAFDVSRLLADPTAQAKEFVLPVPQLSAQLQLSSTLTLGAYYQFRYRANRLPAVGSYFSVNDTNVDGAERLLLGPTASAVRSADLLPRNGGQYGLQLRWQVAETDLGVYALRFHDKDFQQVLRLGVTPVGVLPTSYYLTYNEDSSAYGVSASRSFGSVNVAVEASLRRNQALASTHASDASGLAPPGVIPASDNSGNPAYAIGNTAHANASVIWSLEPSALWREASLVGEIAWNRLLSCRINCVSVAPGVAAALDPNATRDAVSLRAVFEPTYRQVVSGLDLGFPLGVGYTPKGSRSIMGPSFPAENGGDITLGVNGVYEQVWRFSVAYTHFAGSAGTLLDATQSFSYQQARKDRDFLALNVRRSF
jgi:hypothetical protein